MHELVCEVKRWCLDRMHLHGDLYLCPSQETISSQLMHCAPVFVFSVCLRRVSGTLMGMTLQTLH